MEILSRLLIGRNKADGRSEVGSMCVFFFRRN
jgi:hypothetical protein